MRQDFLGFTEDAAELQLYELKTLEHPRLRPLRQGFDEAIHRSVGHDGHRTSVIGGVGIVCSVEHTPDPTPAGLPLSLVCAGEQIRATVAIILSILNL